MVEKVYVEGGYHMLLHVFSAPFSGASSFRNDVECQDMLQLRRGTTRYFEWKQGWDVMLGIKSRD